MPANAVDRGALTTGCNSYCGGYGGLSGTCSGGVYNCGASLSYDFGTCTESNPGGCDIRIACNSWWGDQTCTCT